MGEIVNLRRARKEAKRRDDAERAAANRLSYGRTKAEKSLEEARSEKARHSSRCTQDRHGGHSMKSPVVKRSIVIAGHKTSVSLEDAFWSGLKDIAVSRNLTLSELVASIDTDRRQGNLSSAIRLFVLDHYRALAGSAGARSAEAREAGGGRPAMSALYPE